MRIKLLALLCLLSFHNLCAYAQSDVKSPEKQQSAQSSTKINLNTTDAATLTGSFKGIGKKRAEAIIAYRDNHRGFKALEELAEVKGIGQHFVQVNKEALKKVYVVE